MSAYVDDMRKSAHTSSGLQEVNCWLEKRLIRAVVRKSLQPNLIKAAVCVLAWIPYLILFFFFFFATASVNL